MPASIASRTNATFSGVFVSRLVPRPIRLTDITRSCARYDHVLDLRHVAVCCRGCLVRAAPALASVHVRRVPVPPVVRGGSLLEGVVTLGRLMQQLRQ